VGAIENYEKAIKLLPNFPEAELQRGSAYQSLGKLSEAESAFRKALELRDDWTLAMATLGSLLVQRNKLAEAEPFLARAIEADEMNFPAYAAMTELRLRTKAPAEGLGSLLSKIRSLTTKANPTASIWAARAALENALGDRKSAKISAARALELDPKYRFALLTSADLALADNDPSSADVFIKRLEGIAPRTDSTIALRARVMVATGKTIDAIGYLKAVENPGPEVVDLKRQLVGSGSADTSELEKQLGSSPGNPILLGKLCAAYRTSDPPKALDFCRRAAEAEPNNAQPVVGYAAALVQAKRYDEAIGVLRKLLTAVPDNTTARANLATALFQAKRLAEAKVEFRWLTEHQPDQAIAFYFLAIIHDQLLEFADAAANYQQFLRIADPESSKLEIEKVNLRLPVLQKLVKEGKGKKRG
jgi:tetratricopeptide (TPR) repeat protein